MGADGKESTTGLLNSFLKKKNNFSLVFIFDFRIPLLLAMKAPRDFADLRRVQPVELRSAAIQSRYVKKKVKKKAAIHDLG